MTNYFHLTAFSANKKTGLMPVSTSDIKTCPDACPLKAAGCYAKSGPLAIHWKKVSSGERSINWQDFLNKIRKLDKNALWRHNQAGDLIGSNDEIDTKALKELVNANNRRRGFTYTHYPMNNKNNIEAVKHANENGFTVNLSANTIKHADVLKRVTKNVPIVVILPMDAPKVQVSPEGNKIVVCPAQTREKVNCATCKLCAIPDRSYIIGFKAHGTQKNRVNEIVNSL